jgi:malate dehydrogenase (oxaloacetate-decarboxylating)
VVKLSKDFIGRDALARIKADGVARKLVGLEVAGAYTVRNGYPIMRNGKSVTVDQTNNAYVFPGVGLGVLAVGARRVSDNMFKAAAGALAAVSPARHDPTANLLPAVSDLRSVAVAVAQAVGRAARADGLCEPLDDDAIARRITARMWEPTYRPYRLRKPSS